MTLLYARTRDDVMFLQERFLHSHSVGMPLADCLDRGNADLQTYA
jgi:hypothetical protein